MISSRLGLIPRRLVVQGLRNYGGHHDVNWMGNNLFFSIDNHRMLAVKMALFFGIPFWIPFLNLRFQLKKSSGA